MNRTVITLITVALLLSPFWLAFEVAHSGAIEESVSAGNSSALRTHYPWSMFRYDPQHTGYTSSSGPETNQTLWVYATDYEIWGPCPSVSDGILYIGGGYGPYMYALNASTGKQVWNYTSGYWIASTPAVVDGVLYFGSFDQNVTALNADTGTLIWSYLTDGYLAASSPAVVDDVVYIGGGYGESMYALNATNGDLIWKEPVGGAVHSSPAVADGIVYVGSDDGNVYAFNASSGDVIWKFPTKDVVFSSPAVVDGVVYAGSNDNTVYALNAIDGTSIWNYTTGFSVISSPAVANGVVYVGSYDQNIYALSATTGAKIWNYTTGGAVTSSPAIAGDLIYVGSSDNRTYALNAIIGTKIWSYLTDGYVWASPAVADGVVYMASTSERSRIYAVGDQLQWPRVSFSYSPAAPFANELVTFDASESYDPDGYIANYSWDFGDGNVTVTTEPIIDHQYTIANTYTVNLTVTDNESLTETAWTTVKVGGFPVARFSYSPAAPFANELVTFNASESYDRDGVIESYEWDFGDDNLTTTTVPIIDHTYTVAGAYTVNLTVTDNDALSDSESVQITVGKDPVADFTWSPEKPLVGETLTFDASLSTPEGGTIVQYSWNFGDESIVVEPLPITTHVYTKAGSYQVTLTVKDSEDLTGTTLDVVTVRNYPVAIFTYSPTSPTADETVTFNASLSVPDGGTIVSYKWDFGDNSPQVTEDDPVTTHVYSSSGIFSITLTVMDNEELGDNLTRSITIEKIPSETSISLSSGKINLGESVNISGVITPLRAGATVTIRYRLAGENWDTLPTVTSELNGDYAHIWEPSKAGDYEIQARWIGDANTLGSESSVATLTVEEVPAPPLMQYAVLVVLIIIAAVIAIYFLRFRRNSTHDESHNARAGSVNEHGTSPKL